jgi:DNA-binding transcriptional LysR family regulator
VDLNLLVALDALLQERNVTHAGERLCLSQSAMSGNLARLRQLFDDELLVRVGRNLELTAFAEEIAGPVSECVQQIEDLLNAKRPFVPETENRVFQIAATDYSIMLMLGPLVKRLEKLAPNISVRFVKLDSLARGKLDACEIDFSILPKEIDTGLPSVPLFKDRFVCIAWSGHPKLKKKMTREWFLAQQHMVFNIGDDGHHSIADQSLQQQGYKRNIVASTESFTNAPFLLQGTSMITVVPRRLAERLKDAANITLLELPMKVPQLSEKLMWNPRFTTSKGHIWMRDLMVEIANTL